VLASSNQGKIREIQQILAPFKIKLLSLLEIDNLPPIVEDGDSFAANALKKARTIQEHTKGWVLADDSGLEVEALGGAPGVLSARYSGEKATDTENNTKLLHEMEKVADEQRTACFKAAIVLLGPNGEQVAAEGRLDGMIAHEPCGDNGFGYDPVFYLPEFKKTAAQLTAEQKNAISHRARALKKLSQQLTNLFKNKR